MSSPTIRIRAGLLAAAFAVTSLTTAIVGVGESHAADQKTYIEKAAKAATASRTKYRVPRSVTIAQSILESGWGRSGLSTKYKNYFGIKCSPAASPHQKACVSLGSYEYFHGSKRMYVSKFRTYSSMENSFLDHGRLLDRGSRYNRAFKYVNNPNKFIRAVHKAGYATDPGYANLVISIMKRWNLYRFDTKLKTETPKSNAKTLIATVALPE